MATLLGPLRRRRIWVVFIVVLIVGGVVDFLGRPGNIGSARLTSALLLTVGLAALGGGLVAFFGNYQPDYRVEVMKGIDRGKRRRVRRAVMAGNLDRLPAEDQALGEDYADAYVASTPRVLSPIILILVGSLFEGASQLVSWDGGWATYLTVFQVVFVGVALIVGLPLQVRWLKNATRVSTREKRSLVD